MATASATSTVTVNAAFLQEIKEVNQELWDLLEELEALCRKPDRLMARRNQFIGMLDDLRDHLALHFALEEAYGYFNDPIEVAPRLSELAGELRSEHRWLYLLVCRIGEFAEQPLQGDRVSHRVMGVVDQFQDFAARLRHHEARENDLILRVYDDDIGVGD
jgi:hypothetical protein